jgi:spermidine synthase
LTTTLAVIGVYSIILPFVFSVRLPSEGVPQLVFPVLALLGGCLTGMVFPLATAVRIAPIPSANREGANSSVSSEPPSAISHQPSAIGGTLYAADLAGGCLGALVGAVLLVPILGIPQTCAAIALVALAGLIAIL